MNWLTKHMYWKKHLAVIKAAVIVCIYMYICEYVRYNFAVEGMYMYIFFITRLRTVYCSSTFGRFYLALTCITFTRSLHAFLFSLCFINCWLHRGWRLNRQASSWWYLEVTSVNTRRTRQYPTLSFPQDSVHDQWCRFLGRWYHHFHYQSLGADCPSLFL